VTDHTTPDRDLDEMDDPLDELEPEEDISEEEGWEQAEQSEGEAPSG
jgi:hypothetical protein